MNGKPGSKTTHPSSFFRSAVIPAQDSKTTPPVIVSRGSQETQTGADDSRVASRPSRSLSGTLRYAMWTGLAVVSVYVAATAVRVYERKYYVFLPDYVRWSFAPAAAPVHGPTHIFFLYVDHFEPAEDLNRTR